MDCMLVSVHRIYDGINTFLPKSFFVQFDENHFPLKFFSNVESLPGHEQELNKLVKMPCHNECIIRLKVTELCGYI